MWNNPIAKMMIYQRQEDIDRAVEAFKAAAKRGLDVSDECIQDKIFYELDYNPSEDETKEISNRLRKIGII